jgi:hypothetical protein
MSESNVELSEQDIADLAQLAAEPSAEPPTFHTILQVWKEVLAPADKVSKEQVTPIWANKMVTNYFGLTFSDLNSLRDLYFARLEQLRQILLEELATDADCFTHLSPEEDREENRGHYKQVILNWQLQFLQWELDWDCTSKTAAIEMASFGEVYKMFFGEQGLLALLEQIGFEFTEADQAELGAVLDARKAEVNGE